jgi:hypothetical protein
LGAAFEILVFTLAAIALYFAADWALNRIEIRRGARFQHRSIVFFFIILVLALGLFEVMQRAGSA